MRCSRLYSLAGLNTTTHRRQGHRSRWARPNGVPTVGGGWGLVYPATELPLCGKGRQYTPLARPGPREVWRSHFSARTAKPDRPGVWPLAGLAPFFLRPNANANANAIFCRGAPFHPFLCFSACSFLSGCPLQMLGSPSGRAGPFFSASLSNSHPALRAVCVTVDNVCLSFRVGLKLSLGASRR